MELCEVSLKSNKRIWQYYRYTAILVRHHTDRLMHMRCFHHLQLSWHMTREMHDRDDEARCPLANNDIIDN